MLLYNYTTQQYEPFTPTLVGEYLPRIPVAQNLYALYCLQGLPPTKAAIKVLELCCAQQEHDHAPPLD